MTGFPKRQYLSIFKIFFNVIILIMLKINTIGIQQLNTLKPILLNKKTNEVLNILLQRIA